MGPAKQSCEPLDVALLDAGERQALVCLRSLARAGVRVGAFESRPRVPAFSSRWCAAHGLLPDCTSGGQRLGDALVELVDAYGPKLVVAAHDGTIEALRQRRPELEARASLGLAPEPALEIAVDKERTYALAASLGIPLPRTVAVHHVDELAGAADAVGFPLVLKPARSWVRQDEGGWRLGPQIALDRRELHAAAGPVLSAGTSVVLQQWVPGSREAISLFCVDDRVYARFAQEAHRMIPPLGGASVLRESIPLPADLVDAAERLVRAAGLNGYSEVEFRRDADGRGLLMEVNPRLSASVEVAVRAGVDFPQLLYRWATGQQLEPVTQYRVGTRMRWFGGDLRWLRRTLKTQGRPDAVPSGRAVASFVNECFRPAAYDYVDRSDLRPALVAGVGFFRDAARARMPTLLRRSP